MSERSGSAVECLTRDRGAASWSLTGIPALSPRARHINPSLVLVQPRKNRPYITEILLIGRKEQNQTNKYTFSRSLDEVGLVKYLFITDRCMRAANAQTSLRRYAGSPEYSLLTLAISAHSYELGHMFLFVQGRKTARTRNRYNQVPHLSLDTKWERNKITINITNKSQEVSHFPLGDHKEAMNRHENMTNTRHK